MANVLLGKYNRIAQCIHRSKTSGCFYPDTPGNNKRRNSCPYEGVQNLKKCTLKDSKKTKQLEITDPYWKKSGGGYVWIQRGKDLNPELLTMDIKSQPS